LKRDLIAGPPAVLGPAEHLTGQRVQRRVVVQRRSRPAPQLEQGLAKQRKCFRRYLEAQHAPARRRRLWCEGIVARALVRHELFQLSHGLALRHVQPGRFGFRDSHARELTRRGPAEHAGLQRARQTGQRRQRLGDPQLLLRRARPVPKQPLDVLEEATKTQVHMRP
jgi:hypothetical protein